MLSLKKLVDKHEALSENPVRLEDLSKKTMRQIRGIVGFEIEIEDIQGVKKMSQTRDDQNYQNIITELRNTKHPNAIAVAETMLKCTR